MRYRGLHRLIAGVVLALSAGMLAAGGIGAVPPDDYAYLYIQGRLSNPSTKEAMAGAEVQLTSGGRVFTASTDPKGSFVFEKLPVATYEMHITTADGRVIQSMEQVGMSLSGPKRYRTRFARGPAAMPLIEAGEKGVTVTLPKPAVNRKRFWKQFAIFAGGALVLAL
jgi:carboxypeptidase family protein